MPTRAEAIAQLTAAGQPHELVAEELYGKLCRTFKNAPPTLRELYHETRSGETFLVYDDERYSFEETYQLACRVAGILVDDYGVLKGDRVAISMRNFPEWVICFMAATSIGAIAVAMNALWHSDEMEYGLTDSGAKVLFADQERLDRLADCSNAPSVDVIAVRPLGELPDSVADYRELVAARPPQEMPATDAGPRDDALILYTSGSTGRPKGAVSCHRNVVTALMSWELDVQAGLLVLGEEPPALEHQAASLCAVPLFHATGSHAVYLNSYRNQRKMVLMYKWDAERGAEIIEREKITSFIAPAAMTGDLVQTARLTKRDLSTLMGVGGGGAPRAPEQVKQIDEAFANAMPGTGWGMTETNAIGTGIGGQDYLDRPASSGRCSAVLDMRVVDEDGAELTADERGELHIRGTSVIRGYWNRPDADAETFTEDGWLRTGDVAYLDDEGFLFIVDRIKDLVIRGGENIGCGQVEAAILEHPGVLEASVYAVPDRRLGEEVGATVYCAGEVGEEELRAFLDARLARFEIPRYFDFAAEPLPRIASGKIFKRGLREAAVARLGA
ncbi:MAG: class I adenylate-forming enzyme family protein [Acidobacteriota bacterium]|nr:class I adenylate-forming enzyme family protein [Acidobacteriota bacterium]